MSKFNELYESMVNEGQESLSSAITKIMKDVMKKNSHAHNGTTISPEAINSIVRKHYKDNSTDTQHYIMRLVTSYMNDIT